MEIKAAEGLRRAAAFHARGEFAAAVKTAKAVVSRHPREPAALHFLGVLCCQAGEVQEGTAYLERAFRSDPRDGEIRRNLTQALLDAGRAEEAEKVCSGADFGSSVMKRLRAEIAKARGQTQEAVALYEELAQEQPSNAAVWNNLGNLYADLGAPEEGLKALKRARSLEPHNPLIPANLGRILHSLERQDESRAMFREALRLSPAQPGKLVELGELLQRLDEPQLALLAFSGAARAKPRDPQIYVLIGQCFTTMAEIKKAEQAYRTSLHVGPHFAPAYLNLAILLEEENRIDELRTLVAYARDGGVAGGEMNFISALVCRRDKQLADALRLAQDSFAESLDPSVRAHFIGQVADQLGETDTAFAAFEDMNRMVVASPAGSALTGEEHRQEVDSMCAALSADWCSCWTCAEPPRSRPSPVFLMGFLRSGTTLLDTILMGHPQTFVLEEDPILAAVERAGGSFDRLPYLDARELSRLRERYFQELELTGHDPGERLVIDKNPLAGLRAPLIHRIFPDARFVFAVRHPYDVVLSCFMQNLRPTKSTAAFLNMRNAALFYSSVMAYWSKCRSLLPLNVHVVRYEDLIEDVESELRPLLSFLGLDWHSAVLDHQRTATERGYIRTPSYAQVTERIHSRSVGRWRRYREHIADVLPILRPWAEGFGYEVD